MITATGATKALYLLRQANLSGVNDGQPIAWVEMFKAAIPGAGDDDLIEAVMALATTRTSTGRGGSWVVIADVIEQVKIVRRRRIESAEREVRQIEAANPVINIDTARMLAEIRRGVDPKEAVDRARRQAEGAS